MSYEIPGFSLGTLVAGADLSALQYTFVAANSSGKVVSATAGGDVLGVLQNTPTSDGAAQVLTSGVSKVKCSGTVTAGLAVKVAASTFGAVNASTSGKGVGIALESGTSGQIVAVLLKDLGTQS
jgi:hypothetical protein